MVKNTEIYELVKDRIAEKFEVPERVRDEVWNEISYDQSGLVLSERRPHFQRPEIITKHPIFKIKYNSQKKDWSVYWMPSDGKWHIIKTYSKLDKILKYIEEHGEYFWG